MRFFVRCDSKGKILSAIEVSVMSENLEHPFAQPLDEDQQVFEIASDPIVTSLDLHELVEQYTVDTSTGKLRKLAEARPPAAESAPPQPPTSPERYAPQGTTRAATKRPKKTKPK